MFNAVATPTLLMMCTGNVCRSPMAEALLLQQITKKGLEAMVFSRGFSAPIGRAPHPYAIEVATRRGVPIDSSKRAGLISRVDINLASVIFVMDSGHKREMQQRFPTATGKTFLLGQWSGEEIPDPINQPLEVFERTWEFCEAGVRTWVERLVDAGMFGKTRAGAA